jgi:cell division septation protein DedD
MGTFATVAYIAGRKVPPAAGQNSQLAEKKEPGAERATVLPVATAAPKPEPPMPMPEPLLAEPMPGEVYLQVAAVGRGVADVFAEHLRRKGFSTCVVTGPDETTFRVLVGPVSGSESLSDTKAALDAGGFHPFVRRY